VVNPYTRHPALLAMEAGALSGVAPGRVVLGDAVEVDVRRPSRVRSWVRAGATSVKRALLRAAALGVKK
jgi:hypothetical protein